jgi:two-component system, NtrC family, response regulator GlrR
VATDDPLDGGWFSENATESTGRAAPSTVARFRLVTVEGPAPGALWESTSDRCSIGSHPSNDLVIEDPTVSRFHCEVRLDPRLGVRVHDLESRNGTFLDGVQVQQATLRGDSLLKLGRSTLRFELGAERNRLPISESTKFGSLIGVSVAMRTTFALLERAAESDATVLLEGETGTGKEGAAESIHAASARSKGPFVVVDCSALPAHLLESELFGHESGAFTGATGRRIGAFEEANGGTIFLDEIGELAPELQPKFLRVLEAREVRRLGSNSYRPLDVRIIAATNRDLRAEVNAGQFRSDVYFRIAVVKVGLPSLRARPEDIPVLVEHMLTSLGADASDAAALREPDFVAGLYRAAWPGNVRELRNYVERCVVMRQQLPIDDSHRPPASATMAVNAKLSYDEARQRALQDFESAYVAALLELYGGNVAAAARSADMNRVYLHRLLRKHGLRGG